MTIKLFFDENFSKRAADALSGLLLLRNPQGIVDHYVNRWDQGSLKDEHFIPLLAKEGGWIVIAADLGRSKGKKLPRLCADYSVTHLLLSPGIHNLRTFEKTMALLAVWNEIEKIADGPEGQRHMLYAGASASRPHMKQKPIY